MSPNRTIAALMATAGGQALPSLSAIMLPVNTAATARNCPTTLSSASIACASGWSEPSTALAGRRVALAGRAAISDGRFIAPELPRLER